MNSKKKALSVVVALAILTLPAVTLAGHGHDSDEGPQPFPWHDQGWHRGWFKHHRHVRKAWDEDDQGDYSHVGPVGWPPAFLCDADGDDCESNPGASNPGYWNYGHRVPISYYREFPPADYNLVQQRNWLLDHQRRAYNALTLMRARHDRNAMQRISTVIHGLDARIARDNRLLAGH